MKKENQKLFIAFLLGVISSALADFLFELRSEAFSWIANNLLIFIVFLVVVTVIGYLMTK